MLRQRVTTPSLRRNLPDLSVAIADITTVKDGISVPTLVAQVIKEVLRDRAPTPPPGVTAHYTPFLYDAVFSGADTLEESKSNHTTVITTADTVQVTCDTVLLPTTRDIPMCLYLTGRETDLPIIGQECTVTVSGNGPTVTKKAVARHDQRKHLYLEVQEKGKLWQVHHPSATLRFHVSHHFPLK